MTSEGAGSVVEAGSYPDVDGLALIPASVGRMRAMRMMILGERISAAEALHWGLVTAEYSDDTFVAESSRIVEQLAAGPTRALQKTKEAVNSATLAELDAALELEGRGQDELLRSDDFAKSIAAFARRTVSR